MNADRENKEELIRRLSKYKYFNELPDEFHVPDGDLRFKIQRYILPIHIKLDSTIKDIIEAIKKSSM